MGKVNTKFTGDIGEQMAVDYLKEKGYKILERNIELQGCEVDIICEANFDENGNLIKSKSQNKLSSFVHKLLKISPLEKGEKTLVFIEVKTRYGAEYGAPEEAVNAYKVGRYVTCAKAYISQRRLANMAVRFDIIAIDEGGLRHIEDAFGYNDAKYPRNY